MQEILGIRRNGFIYRYRWQAGPMVAASPFLSRYRISVARGEYRGGCGMVALGDLLLYLMEKEIRPYQLDGITYHTVFEEKEAYRTYFNKLCRSLSGFLRKMECPGYLWQSVLMRSCGKDACRIVPDGDFSRTSGKGVLRECCKKICRSFCAFRVFCCHGRGKTGCRFIWKAAGR